MTQPTERNTPPLAARPDLTELEEALLAVLCRIRPSVAYQVDRENDARRKLAWKGELAVIDNGIALCNKGGN